MQMKGIYFKVKFMIEYISTSPKKLFLLLNIRISINFQSPFAVRNPNKNKLVQCDYIQCLQKQENICTINIAVLNTFVTQRN